MKNFASNGISLDSNKYKNKAYPILTGFRLVTSILSGACCMLYSFAAWTSNWFFSICASFSSKPGGALLVMIFWKRIRKFQFCILITKMKLFEKKISKTKYLNAYLIGIVLWSFHRLFHSLIMGDVNRHWVITQWFHLIHSQIFVAFLLRFFTYKRKSKQMIT